EAPLAMQENLTVRIRTQGQEPRVFRPFVRFCPSMREVELGPGAARFDSIFLGGGLSSAIVEPGIYEVTATLRIGQHLVQSRVLPVQVDPPIDKVVEERVAADFQAQDIGRLLAVDGSRGESPDLMEARTNLPHRRVALHARVCAADPMVQDFKELDFE